MRKLKIVFHVEDAETKEIVVEKLQLKISVADRSEITEGMDLREATDAACSLSKDVVLSLAMLGREAGWEEKVKDSGLRKSFLDEQMRMIGDRIGRDVFIRLREWALKQRVPA
jgi:hypothetical protein